MKTRNNILVLTGALTGGIVGHFLFFWLVEQGFYGIILPGSLVGLVSGIGRATSKFIPLLCGILALVCGLITEWRFQPLAADESLGYFLVHFHELQPVTLILIGLASLIALWIPYRRSQ